MPHPIIGATAPKYDYRGCISQRCLFIFISHALNLIKSWSVYCVVAVGYRLVLTQYNFK